MTGTEKNLEDRFIVNEADDSFFLACCCENDKNVLLFYKDKNNRVRVNDEYYIDFNVDFSKISPKNVEIAYDDMFKMVANWGIMGYNFVFAPEYFMDLLKEKTTFDTTKSSKVKTTRKRKNNVDSNTVA